MQHRTPFLYCRATVPTLCFTSEVSIADLLRADAQWMKQIAKMYVIVVTSLALVFLPTPSASQVDNTKLTLPARVINVTAQVCPPDEVRVSEQNKVAEVVLGLLRTTTATACKIFQTQSSSAISCSVKSEFICKTLTIVECRKIWASCQQLEPLCGNHRLSSSQVDYSVC